MTSDMRRESNRVLIALAVVVTAVVAVVTTKLVSDDSDLRVRVESLQTTVEGLVEAAADLQLLMAENARPPRAQEPGQRQSGSGLDRVKTSSVLVQRVSEVEKRLIQIEALLRREEGRSRRENVKEREVDQAVAALSLADRVHTIMARSMIRKIGRVPSQAVLRELLNANIVLLRESKKWAALSARVRKSELMSDDPEFLAEKQSLSAAKRAYKKRLAELLTKDEAKRLLGK